jgi:AcrR family transcriptional regulator
MRTTQAVDPPRPTFGGRARREQLVDCAVEVLTEAGYAGITIGAVARRAAVSKGVVTYHFSTKEALLLAVVASLYERAGGQIAARVETSDTALAALLGYIEANLRFVAGHAAHVRAVIEIAANLRRPTGELALGAAEADPVAAHLRQLIQRGQDRGEFARIDAGVLATVIRAAIDTAAARLSMDDRFDVATYERELTLIVRRAVTAEDLGTAPRLRGAS